MASQCCIRLRSTLTVLFPDRKISYTMTFVPSRPVISAAVSAHKELFVSNPGIDGINVALILETFPASLQEASASTYRDNGIQSLMGFDSFSQYQNLIVAVVTITWTSTANDDKAA